MSIPATVERARRLLEQKAVDLPDAERVRAGMRADAASSADDFYSALIEGAFLVAAADDEFSEDEASTLGETIAHVTGEPLPTEEFRAMIDAFAEALSLDGFDGRIRTIAESITDPRERREIVSFAALLGLCDHHFDVRERQVVFALARAFGLSDERVEAILEGVEAGLREGS